MSPGNFLEVQAPISRKIIINKEGRRKLLEVMGVFMVVMGPPITTYLQTHRVVYVKYLQRFVCQPDLHKVVFKRKKCQLLGPTPELLYQNSGGGTQPSLCDSDACSQWKRAAVSSCLSTVRNVEPQAPTGAD